MFLKIGALRCAFVSVNMAESSTEDTIREVQRLTFWNCVLFIVVQKSPYNRTDPQIIKMTRRKNRSVVSDGKAKGFRRGLGVCDTDGSDMECLFPLQNNLGRNRIGNNFGFALREPQLFRSL